MATHDTKAEDKAAEKKAAKAAKAEPANVHDFPRMLHKGESRMVVKSEEELKAAKADGWCFHRDVPEPPDPDDPTADISLMTDIAALETLRNEEVGAPKVAHANAARVRAINARIQALREANQAVPPPKAPDVAEPPSGSQALRAQIATMHSVPELKALRVKEQANPNGARPEVVAAIDARIDALT